MSYAKFGWDNSDVYLFGSVLDLPPNDAHVIVCALCRLDDHDDRWERESLDFETKEELFAHLNLHRAAGHVIPASAMQAIEEDDWI